METTVFYIFMSIVTGLLLFVIGWIVNLGIKLGKFDEFIISTLDRLAKMEVRLDLIDKLNGFLDSVDRRLSKIEMITSNNNMMGPRVKKK